MYDKNRQYYLGSDELYRLRTVCRDLEKALNKENRDKYDAYHATQLKEFYSCVPQGLNNIADYFDETRLVEFFKSNIEFIQTLPME